MTTLIYFLVFILAIFIFMFIYRLYEVNKQQQKYVASLKRMDKIKFYDPDTLIVSDGYFEKSFNKRSVILNSNGDTEIIDSSLIINER